MTTKATPSKPAPLGRGLSALFGDTDAAYRPRPFGDGDDGTQPGSVNKKYGPPPELVKKKVLSGQIGQDMFREIPIDRIVESPLQSRRHFDEASIEELADSIKKTGIIQPIIVRAYLGSDEAGMFEVVAGERRWRAAQRAELHAVPAIVRNLSDHEALEINIVENVQRQDLSPIEEAEGYSRLLEEFGYTQERLAQMMGKSRPHITNTLRLMKLPEKVKAMLLDGRLSMTQARAIITAKDPLALAEIIVKKGMTAKQAEALAKKESDGRFAKKDRVSSNTDPNIVALERDLSSVLGLKTRITVLTATSGSLTVQYQSLDQFEALIRKLQG